MYSPQRICERIHEAEREFSVTLEYHTIAEVDAFEDHLVQRSMYVYDGQGRIEGTQNLTEFERDWMLNEQLLCMCDAMYSLTRYCYVKNEQNVIERFNMRVPQRILYDIICDLDSNLSSIEIMILKARQLGVSTLVELLIAHRIIFGYGVNATIFSADQTKTGLMAGMLFLVYDMMPVWLKPRATRRVESDRGMLQFGGSRTGVQFQHGSQKTGISRGTTPTIYHGSEIASIANAEHLIDASLLKAVHASPNVFGFLESTGEGDKGWFPDTWRHAKLHWKEGRARLCPLFLPWFCGVDIYPTPTWLHMRPVPPEWRPNSDTRKHVAKAELFVRSQPLLEKYLIEEQKRRNEFTPPFWRMPWYQQWFWEVEHEQAKERGYEGLFLQEMAGDDEEALQRSSESIFGHEAIQVLDAARKRDYFVYGISGQSIESVHEPPSEDIDYSEPREIVRFTNPRAETYRWEFIPLRPDLALRENDPDDANGKLFVFHPPRPRVSYAIGVDTSTGIGSDQTVINVWTVADGGAPDVQCAEFSSRYVNHVEAFAFVMCIAAYYKRFMIPGETRWKEPYLAIEQVQAVGDTCQHQLKKMGYSNFHRMTRYDGKRVSKANAIKQGWYTFGWSRPILTGNFVNAVKNNWAVINSPWLLNEMKSFESHVTKTGRRKMEHEDGANDDRIFAAAMAIFCPHDMDALVERSAKRMIESPTDLPPVDIAPHGGTIITQQQMRGQSRPMSLEELVYLTPQELRKR
jgi:hypothetical protein